MIHGICEYAQRTSSLRMCNTLHENDACILHIIYTYPHLFEIFFKMPERNYNNTELAISKLYGHVWTTRFSRCFSHWNSLPSWTELAQEPSNRLILCWGYFTWKQYLGNTFLTCLYPWEAPFQMHVLFVLVWGFEFEGLLQLRMPQKDAEVMWNCSLSSFPQVSTQSMNATMKVNGKLWTLALGFKEGLSLGDRTSAQSTLLTWGVNSVWSNLNSWREEWRQHQTLYKSLQVNSSIYGFWNDIKTHECGAININCSAQAGLHWTMHEHRARMKLWRFWRVQNLGCTNVSTIAGRSFRSPKLPARRSYSHRFWLCLCFTWGMKLERLSVEQLSCWCDLWIDGAALMFHAPLVISVRKCKHLCAHKQITVFREVQNWRNMFLIWVLFLIRYVSTTETTLYQRAFWSFLPTILFAWSVWSHHAASWHILVQASEDWNQASVAMCSWQTCQLASPFDRDKFTGLSLSMLELLRSPLIWIGPLVLPCFAQRTRTSRCCMAARVAPTLQAGNTLALAYTCWKSDNSWAGQWGVLLCLKDPKGMNMSTVRKRRTCFYLLPFCLPFWAAFMTLSFKTVLNILTWVPSHRKSKESDDCVHWIVHVLNLRPIQPQIRGTSLWWCFGWSLEEIL